MLNSFKQKLFDLKKKHQDIICLQNEELKELKENSISSLSSFKRREARLEETYQNNLALIDGRCEELDIKVSALKLQSIARNKLITKNAQIKNNIKSLKTLLNLAKNKQKVLEKAENASIEEKIYLKNRIINIRKTVRDIKVISKIQKSKIYLLEESIRSWEHKNSDLANFMNIFLNFMENFICSKNKMEDQVSFENLLNEAKISAVSQNLDCEITKQLIATFSNLNACFVEFSNFKQNHENLQEKLKSESKKNILLEQEIANLK